MGSLTQSGASQLRSLFRIGLFQEWVRECFCKQNNSFQCNQTKINSTDTSEVKDNTRQHEVRFKIFY